MTQPQYSIHRFPLGWAVTPAPGQQGIPISTMGECARLFPKDATIDPGIAHHLNETTSLNAALVITTNRDSMAWRKEIAESMTNLSPQERWWKGTNVGTSSAALFAALCDHHPLKIKASEMGKSSTPKDHADFQRCLNLVNEMGWKNRLPEAAQAYPNTPWPQIIQRWDELEQSTPRKQDEILNEENSRPRG